MRKNGEDCRRVGMVFIPLVVETLWGWEEHAGAQIKKLVAALTRQTGQEEAEKIRHVFQSLPVRLGKGNTALFLNRTPSFPDPEVDSQEWRSPLSTTSINWRHVCTILLTFSTSVVLSFSIPFTCDIYWAILLVMCALICTIFIEPSYSLCVL